MTDPSPQPPDVAGDSARGELLATIIDLLPVGLTVEDAGGGVVLANAAAGQILADTAEPPAGLAVAQTDARQPTRDPGQADGTLTVEETLGGVQQRSYLTSRRPVRIQGRDLTIATRTDITERRRAERELARRVYFDELTGLPNRALLEERVHDLLGRIGDDHRFALAFIDIDNFKHINDYYSHSVGDALLAKVAQRIAALIGGNDMLARISGDEFVLLIDPVTTEAELSSTVNGLSEALRLPMYLETFEVFTSASIGVSIYPDHGRAYEMLRRNADSAMYRVKSAAKGGTKIYDLEMGKAVAARMELEQRLRLAIRDKSFRCAFQPKVDIHSREVVGLEALIRWCDEGGVISPPGNFIGLAVELGLIDEITHFVLAECVRSLDQLDAAFGPQTTISINVAAKQACDLAFMREFTAALAASGCPERLMIEITEDAFIAKRQFQNEVLPMLRRTGVRVSIDDFGTGYSSLSALADITADEVKVDRSFITDIHKRPRSQSVLRTIESLSQALGMSVVVEGVETFEELVYIQTATKIRYAQGYYFAKPRYLEDMAQPRWGAYERRSVEATRERPDTRTRAPSRLRAR